LAAARKISGRHAVIDYRDGAFYLTDTSANGVFVNQSSMPVGRDNSILLHDGDIFTIGDYRIAVSLPQEAEPGSIQATDEFEDPFARLTEEAAIQSLETPTPGQAVAPLEGLKDDQEKKYTLDFVPEAEGLDLSPGTSPGIFEPSAAATGEAQPSALDEFIQQPRPIPEDWDLEADIQEKQQEAEARIPAVFPLPADQDHPPPRATPEAGPAAASGMETGPMPRPGFTAPGKTSADAPRPGKPPAAARPAGDESLYLQALASGLGLENTALTGEPLPRVLENLGQVLHSCVQGTMAVLHARSEIKGEFRMSQTMIRPVENNPLKFSINTSEALHHIVNPKPDSGYLPPLESVNEAYEDIEAHMLAVMVGMQAALKAVLDRFQPEVLEKRLGESALLRNIPLYKHAKTWDLFTELYSDIASEAEDGFHQLFGEAFARAYEEQIRRIHSLKSQAPHD